MHNSQSSKACWQGYLEWMVLVLVLVLVVMQRSAGAVQ